MPGITQDKTPFEEEDILQIGTQFIKAGDSGVASFHVGSLPSGNNIYVNTYIYRATKPGPTLAIIGGLHGDEINGVEVVRRAIQSGLFRQVEYGSILAIPLLNVHGFINFSRNVPDGKDVNRSFPGSRGGSLASKVAHALTAHVLPRTDFLLDLHTGGAGRYNAPQVRYTAGNAESLDLAKEFGVRFIIEKRVIRSSLRQTAGKMGIPVVVYESGEALRFDRTGVLSGVAGIRNTMTKLKMIKAEKKKRAQQPKEQILVHKAGWKRAPKSGIFIWKKKSGDYVETGEILGSINDPFGGKGREIKAVRSGYIIGHANAPVVSQGDALFHIGYDFEIL